MKISKRQFLKSTGALVGALPIAAWASSSQTAAGSTSHTGVTALANITTDVQAISASERIQRIQKAQQLMRQHNIAALIIEPGAAMVYFTGIKWWRSERLTAVVIPNEGDIAIVCPFFEEPSIQESLQLNSSISVWQEDESPFALIKNIIAAKKLSKGDIAFEESVRFFVLQGVMQQLNDRQHVSGDAITRGCRMFKTQHELQLMHKANEITLGAYGHVWSQLQLGMTQQDVNQLMTTAQAQLGGQDIWTMALLNEASAYPHGSNQPQRIGQGSIVLMDCGCSVEGYQSDISRTFVFGEPNAQQNKIWNTVRKGQDIAFAKAQIGTAAGDVDTAVRDFYENEGLGPDYALPGLSHRTGHGIGMQGHEPVNFVRGESTFLQAGMCFSNEPGIYIPGKFGVRLEDCLYMTANGPQWFTEPPSALTSPIGKLVPLQPISS